MIGLCNEGKADVARIAAHTGIEGRVMWLIIDKREVRLSTARRLIVIPDSPRLS